MISDHSASISLPPRTRSVPAARRLVAELLGAWAAEQHRDDAGLLVSELVTNVVRHVGGAASLLLEVRLTGALLRIAVVDSSPAPPVTRPQGSGSPGGHGLWLVDTLADRWGSEDHAAGKQVWFELRDRRAAV